MASSSSYRILPIQWNTFTVKVLKIQTLYFILFWSKFCWLSICFLKYFMEWHFVRHFGVRNFRTFTIMTVAPDIALFWINKYLYFSNFHRKTCWGYSLEASHRGASYEYSQHIFCPEIRNIFLSLFYFYFFFFLICVLWPSRIFHLYWADRPSKVGENRRTRGKNHLTIRKQNLAFPRELIFCLIWA